MSDLILYFENSQGKRTEIGRPSSMDEASQIISDFLKSHNYKSYYTRMWINDNDEVYYDVGSHFEFFVVVKEKV